MCIHIYIYIFSTLLPWRNLWNTSHSKAPRFPLWNYNKRQFIIAPFKGISTMLTEPFLHVRFRSTQKRLLHKSSKSLLSKTEMSSVSSKAKEAISCRPLGKGGGGTKRRITFQTMIEHVAGIHFPTQPCLLYSRLSHDYWIINGCSHCSCKSSSSADFKGLSGFTQSLLFSFSFRKTPSGYLKKNYTGRLI